MTIIAVDDERRPLQTLQRAISEAAPKSEPVCFTQPADALAFAQHAPVDIAFLDIQMAEMNGLELARRLKELHRQTNIIFVTGYSEYALDAFALAASGYVTKPVSSAAVRRELESLRHPVPREDEAGIRVRTFGNFDVFVGGRPVVFSRSKSKEILAYLVDRQGASVTKKELAGILWGDVEYTRSKQVQLQTLISELVKSLQRAGAEKMLIRGRNNLSVDPTAVDCDYYNFIKWDVRAVNAYSGEYMSNYDWAEFTLAALNSRSKGQP